MQYLNRFHNVLNLLISILMGRVDILNCFSLNRTPICKKVVNLMSLWRPGHEVIQLISCSTQLSIKLIRPINVPHEHTSSVTDMLEDLNWDTLETRRSKSQVTMMFKIINGLVDIPAADFVTPASTRTRSHHGKKLRQYATSTDTLKYSFFPCTIPLWNSLPATLAEAPDLVSFKRGLSTFSF